METNKRKTKTGRLVPLTRDETLSQPTVLELLRSRVSTPTKEASTPEGVRVEGSSKKLPSAWKSLLKEKSSAFKEATVSAASSAEKSNTAQISGTPPQNPSLSTNVGSTSEWRPGKNHERNQRRKQRKRLLKGMKGIILTNPEGDFPTASKSASMKRSRKSSSTQSTPTSNPKQNRGRVEPEHAE